MKLRLLQYFLTVAREETISGAAEVLYVTQPTLSRQMIELEEELGAKLFIRGKRRITLTDEGMRLRKRAEEIVDLVEKTEAEFLTPDDTVSGVIYFGAGETHTMSLIARIIKDIKGEYPQIRFHIYSGNALDVSERIDKGLLDFGLLIEAPNLEKYDSIRLPAVDVWGVLMRKDSPLAELDVIRPEDLWDLPLLCPRQRFPSKKLKDWFKKDYEKLNILVTFNLLYNATFLVEEGIGYALCLDKLAKTTESKVLCFRPLEPRLEAHLDIVWKKYQIFSRAAEIFLRKIQERFEKF